MKKQIVISLVSKGRLRSETLKLFKKKKLNIKSKGERDLIGFINYKNTLIKCLFLHARECIDSLANGTADIAISGKDLLFNSEQETQKKIKIYKDLNFGHASLSIFCMNTWIDCQTMLDVSEIASEMLKKNRQPMKCSTKYRRLVENFLEEKNIKNVEVIDSEGATEVMARINQCSLIADISSTGKTAKDNGLKKIKDGLILNSNAALLVSKKSSKHRYVSSFLRLLSK